MESSENLNLPYLSPSQAQKHVTHNEALRMLDATVQISVESRQVADPPADPLYNGIRYIISENATGSWETKVGQIAAWQDQNWEFFAPNEGWLVWVADESALLVYSAAQWTPTIPNLDLNNVNMLGINGATPDETKRLASASDATLLTHSGNNHRLYINKNEEHDHASLILQTGYTGHAELGLTGDNSLSIKTSPDGSDWHTAMKLSSDDGNVSFPSLNLTTNMMINLFSDGGRFGGKPEPAGITLPFFTAPDYFAPYNGSTFSSSSRFIHNNSSYGGTRDALEQPVIDLMDKLKASNGTRRYGPEFHLLDIEAGTGTSAPLTVNGTSRYLMLTNIVTTLPATFSWGFNIYVEEGSVGIKDNSAVCDMYFDGMPVDQHMEIDSTHGWKQLLFVGKKSDTYAFDYSTSYIAPIYGTPGAKIKLALPFLIPATVSPVEGELYGRIPSIWAWS